MAGPSMDDMLKHTHELREHMLKMQGSAQHMSNSFGSFFKSMVGANVLGKVLDPIIGKMEKAVLGMATNMMTPVHLLQQEYDERRANIDLQEANNQLTVMQAARLRAEMIDEIPLLNLKLKLSEEYAKTSKLALGYLGLTVAVLGNTVHQNEALYTSLIKANSSLDARNRLAHVNYDIMLRTGQGFSDVLDAQKALVDLGFATNKNYEQAVETVVLLHKGLGMSVDTAAQLAVVVNNQVRGSFEKVSDVLANIVNQTSLMADEAGRMAKELTTVLSMTRGQTGGVLLPEMIRAVGKYEDALKRMTGSSGAVTQFIKSMTTVEGFGKLGQLGASPDMLNSEKGIDRIMQGFRRLADQMVGTQRTVAGRTLALEALGKMEGMSAEQANELYMSIQNVNRGVTDELTLRDRYLEQSRTLGAGFAMLGNRLVVLLQTGLYPVIWGLNKVVGFLNGLIDTAARLPVLAETLSILAMVAVPVAIVSVGRLTVALLRMAAASNIARFAAGRAALGGLAADLALALAPVVAELTILKKIYEVNEAASRSAEKARWEHGLALGDIADRLAEQAAMQLRSGSVENNARIIEGAYTALRASQKERQIFGDAAADEVKQFQHHLNEFERRAIITRHQFSDVAMTERDKEELNKELTALEAADRIGDKFAKSTKEASEKDRQALMEIKAQENLQWYHNLEYNWLSGPRGVMTGFLDFRRGFNAPSK